MYEILYHEEVVKKDLPKLDAKWRELMRKAIETKLSTNPEIYGKPLRRTLKNYRKLRVGDFRIVFRIENNQVKIFVIQHRSTVYNTTDKRSL